ncbi:hypothetical protein ACGFNU_44260 [Spirillospora sp. NPDC048911]|uniref:hypothetical protein n=1 Tax=Spirillospora sp. NPDC048911 TaxID=3364527 RepID=UPI0037136AE9
MTSPSQGLTATSPQLSVLAPSTHGRRGSEVSEMSAERDHTVRVMPTGARLLYDIARPVHSGIVGAYANEWLRAAFVEALLSDERLPDIVTTHHDLDMMFCGQFGRVLLNHFGERLHVFEALEDAIEHLETRADDIRSGQGGPTIVWFATPGNDADVVHQTIEYWAGLELIALLRGPWLYGPNRHPQPSHRPTHRTQLFTAQPVNDSITLLQAGA